MTHLKDILGYSTAPESKFMQRVNLAHVRLAAQSVIGSDAMVYVSEMKFANGVLTIFATNKNIIDNHTLKHRINTILQREAVTTLIIK
jgi:hypothetical protein